MIKPKSYRALFPDLYQISRLESEARIAALRHPVTRVMGPYWSLGISVEDVAAVKGTDLEAGTFSNLRVLQEAALGTQAEYAQLHGADGAPKYTFPNHHRPHIMRMRFDKFYSYDSPPYDNQVLFADGAQEGASRLSIFALNTLKPNTQATNLGKIAPVVTGATAQPDQDGILVASIGDMPVNKNSHEAYLPACQLVGGYIALKPRPEYLAKMRTLLGIDGALPAAAADDGRALVYALPDGIGLFGSIALPWSDKPVQDWVKITVQISRDPTDPIDRTDPVDRVLVPWPEGVDLQAHGEYANALTWSGALDSLRAALFPPDGHKEGPHWLSLAENASLEPSDLFWPLNSDADIDFLVHRAPDASRTVFLRDAAMAMRLAYRPTDAPPVSVLAIKPGQWRLARDENGLLEVSAKPQSEATQTAHYEYTSGAKESLQFDGDVKLAVPLIATATAIRDAQRLDSPSTLDIDRLWSFVAISGGWLHLPIPNATPANLARFLHRAQDGRVSSDADVTDITEPSRYGTAGALGFQNQPNVAGFRPNERRWAFTLGEVEDAAPTLKIDLEKRCITFAEVGLFGGTIAFDGALRTTPFRQTAERLLPDHSERALANQRLLALSPTLLRGVERRVRDLDSDDHALSMNIDLNGLAFSATADKAVLVVGEMDFSVTMKSPKLTAAKAETRPWMWRRHGHLPTVQTLPLAQSGSAERQPLGVREMAPLRLSKAPGDTVEFTFAGTLDMQRSDPTLVSKSEWERPTNELPWVDEIGMSLLSLPSVTMHPGLANSKDPARVKILGDVEWAVGLETTTHFEFRHDLALLDQGFATASLPKRPPDGETPGLEEINAEPAPLPTAFLPQPDNGPGGARADRSSWLGAWETRQRQSALAATSDREMIAQKAGRLRLQGLLRNENLPVSVTLSQKIVIDDVDPDAGAEALRVLTHIGSYQLVLRETTVPRPGLPAEADLVGFQGAIGGAFGGVSFSFSTANVNGDGQTFHDQRGLNTAPTATPLSLMISRDVTSLDGEEAARLVTIEQPLRQSAGGPLRFWFADLPLTSDGKKLHSLAKPSETDDWTRAASNNTAFRNAHLRAYRWSMGHAGKGAAPILINGLPFEPLSLTSFDVPDEGPIKVGLTGRPFLSRSQSCGQTDVIELPGADGEVRATLFIAEDATFTIDLQAPPIEATDTKASAIRLPLADSGSHSGPVPVLTLAAWPKDTPVAGTLSFVLAQSNWTVQVQAKTSGQDLIVSLNENAPDDANLWLSKIDFTIEPDPRTGALAPRTCTLNFSARLSKDDWTAELEASHDLLAADRATVLDSGSITTAIGGFTLTKTKLHMDAAALLVTWQEAEPTSPIFFEAFKLGHASGALTTALQMKVGSVPLAFEASAIAFDATVPASTAPSTAAARADLTFQRRQNDRAFQLFGKLTLRNLFVWPEHELPEMSEHWTKIQLPSGAVAKRIHDCDVFFEGQPIEEAPIDQLEIAVRTRHQIAAGDGVKPMAWPMLQVLRLTKLETIVTRADTDVELSTFAALQPEKLNIEDDQVTTLMYKSAVCRHGTLEGKLLDAFKDEMTNSSGLLVDLSAHHRLDWRSEDEDTDGRAHALIGLPFLNVLSPESSYDPAGAFRRLLTADLSAAITIHVHSGDLPMGTKHGPSFAATETVSLALSETGSRISAVSQFPGQIPAAALGLEKPVMSEGGADDFRTVFQSFSVMETHKGPRLLAPEHPALPFAVALSVLMDRSPSTAPRAFGFAPSYSQFPAAAVPNANYDAATMAQQLFAYDKRKLGALVAAPIVDTEVENGELLESPNPFTLQVRVPRQDRQEIITLVTADSPPAGLTETARRQRDLAWAAQCFRRLAPWADSGLLVRQSPAAYGAVTLEVHVIAPSGSVSSTRPTTAPTLSRRKPPEPQRIDAHFTADALSPNWASALIKGFAPVSASAALWASDPTGAATTAGPRLTATASEIGWHLGGGMGPYLGATEHLRLVDRARVTYRQAVRWEDVASQDRQRLTQALPNAYQAALPAGMSPVLEAPQTQSPERAEQIVLPAANLTIRLAARPGVWTEARMGLSTSDDKGFGQSSAQWPVNFRSPRPPILALHDRTRASSHETGHVHVGLAPSFILHGPRATRPGVGAEGQGLSRAPRSAWASLLSLSAPAEGLVLNTWDGALVFTAFGSQPLTSWTINKAQARLDGQSFFANLLSITKTEEQITIPAFADAFGTPLNSAAATKPRATPIEIRLELSTPVNEDDSGDLTRELRMTLLTAGDGLGLVERPIYLRFDDPEYNDRLSGPAMIDFAPAPAAEAEIVFAADRRDVRINDRLELALGLKKLDGSAAEKFNVGNSTYLRISRLRRGLKKPDTLLIDGESAEAGAHKRTEAFFALALDKLKLATEGEAPTLQADDQLLLQIEQKTMSNVFKPLISLLFNVVSTPLYPANPSRFACLQMFEGARVHVPLYADGPSADIIELVDPQDLLEGLVRRRAIYLWRSFANRSTPSSIALQKIAASGASWIEEDVHLGLDRAACPKRLICPRLSVVVVRQRLIILSYVKSSLSLLVDEANFLGKANFVGAKLSSSNFDTLESVLLTSYAVEDSRLFSLFPGNIRFNNAVLGNSVKKRSCCSAIPYLKGTK